MSGNAQWAEEETDGPADMLNVEADDEHRFFTWILRCRQPDHQTLKRLFGSVADSVREGADGAPVIADAVAVLLPPAFDHQTAAEPSEAPVVAVLVSQAAEKGLPLGRKPAKGPLPARIRRRNGGGGGVGWESLTATELQVATLATEGLTNRQIGEKLFISRRTAETHLSHVYQKLGVSGRAQVAAEVARRRT